MQADFVTQESLEVADVIASFDPAAIRNGRLESTLLEDAQPGTYRLVFTCGTHTEFWNLILRPAP